MARGSRACLAIAAAGALLGCRNLDLPDVPPDGGAPARFSLVQPAAGETVALLALVRVDAESVHGIRAVTLGCGGGLIVAAWTAAPYSGLVDLSPCVPVAGPPDGGAGLRPLILVVTVVDGIGRSQAQSRDVLLDASTVGLRVEAPSTITPHSFVEVRLQSDGLLAAPPEVLLDGQPPSRVLVETDGGVLPIYRVQFDDTPGLGADSVPPGAPVTFELLTQTERPVRLGVDAQSAQNGNTTHVDLSLLLTRVAWDRPSAGRLALAAAEPVATSEGLQAPLATDDLLPGPGSRWLPGLYARSDGTFLAFDATQLPGGLDGGFVARGLDALGRSLFATNAGSALSFLPRTSPGPPQSFTVPFPLATPLTRVGTALCVPDVLGGTPSAGCFAGTATQRVDCVGSTGPVAGISGTSSTLSLGVPTPGATVASGGAGADGGFQVAYLAPAGTACGDVWAVGALGGSFAFTPRADPDRPGCAFQGIRQALAIGDGTFIVSLDAVCGGLADFPIVRLDATGKPIASYVTARTAAAPSVVQPVAALRDGSLVTLRNAPPSTVFERWLPGATQPVNTAAVSGLYALVPGAQAQAPVNVAPRDDGSLTVLLSGGPNGTAVAHFGPGLSPRWLFFYPRTLVPTTDAPRLVGAPGLEDSYLLDGRNQHIVSLRAGRLPDAGTPPVLVTLNVTAVSVAPGGTVQFQATVQGTAVTDVVWTAPDGGSITQTGLFTAPLQPGTYRVVATSRADPTKSATATVTVSSITVTVSPPTVTLAPGGTQQFSATTSDDSAVTWSAPDGGSVSPGGLFTAPATPGTYRVVATSVTDGKSSGTAIVTVTGPDAGTGVVIVTSPDPPFVDVDVPLALFASVTGPDGGIVTWSWAPDAGTLQVAGNSATWFGFRTCDSTVITATNAADASQKASVQAVVNGIRGITASASPSPVVMGATSTLSATVQVCGSKAPGNATFSVVPGGRSSVTSQGPLAASFTSSDPIDFTVTATSEQDPSKSSTFTLSVVPPPCVQRPLIPIVTPVQTGGQGFTQYSNVPVAIAPNGDVVVGAMERGVDGIYRFYVHRWDGVSWNQVGPPLSSGNTGGGFTGTMALDPTGNPVVAYARFNPSAFQFDLIVSAWDGLAWNEYGSAAQAGQWLSGTSMGLVVPSDGNPVIAYIGPRSEVIVRGWNGSDAFDLLDTAQVGTAPASNPVLGGTTLANLIVGWSSQGGVALAVFNPQSKLVGGSYLGVPPTFDATNANWTAGPSVTFDGTGAPVMAWKNYPDPTGWADIRVARYTAGAWTQLGAEIPGRMGDPFSQLQLVYNPKRDRLAVATVQTTEFNAAVYEFNGTQWVPFCVPAIDPANVDGLAQGTDFTGLAVDAAGNYLLATTSGATGSPKLPVQRMGP
jgi:hypothetical protein